MSFWKRLSDNLGKGAGLAARIASIVDPRLAPLMGVIGAAIEQAERAPGKRGVDKAVIAQGIVTASMPTIVATYEQMFDKELLDEELLADALKDIQEGTVKLYNAFGVMPGK